MTASRLLVMFAVSTSLVGCGADRNANSDTTAVMTPDDGGNYHPSLSPTDATDTIDNQYLPLLPGAQWRYEGESEDGLEVTEVVVTSDRKTVMGIAAIVVHDTVTVDGAVREDTFDWYTQDGAGNVWYLGESTQEFEDGKVVSTAGSWEAGVDGALPGIVMPATPTVGKVFRQEFYRGEAEDLMKITRTEGSFTVPAGTYSDLLTTLEWTPLGPDVTEQKIYAPGVGLINEQVVAGGRGTTNLVEYTPGE